MSLIDIRKLQVKANVKFYETKTGSNGLDLIIINVVLQSEPNNILVPKYNENMPITRCMLIFTLNSQPTPARNFNFRIEISRTKRPF